MAGIPNTKTEYFNHLHVGDVQKYNTENLVSNALKLVGNSTILDELLTSKTSGHSIDELKTQAEGYLTSNSDLYTSFSAFETSFPLYTRLIDKMNANSVADLTEFDTMSASAGVIDLKTVWESLSIHYITNEQPYLVELIQQAIKILEIRNRIAAGDVTTIEEINTLWSKLFIVLPAPLFPLPYKTTEPDTPTEADEPFINEGIELIERCNAARLNIIDSFDLQNEYLKQNRLSKEDFESQLLRGTNEDLDPNNDNKEEVKYDIKTLFEEYNNAKEPEFLSPESITDLDATTRKTLEQLRINLVKLTVPAAINKLDRKANDAMRSVSYAPKKQYVTNIGSAIIEVKNPLYETLICSSSERIDHCRLLQKLHAENPDTSLIQVLGIGYVNTIQQKLKKYEAGEIAHIENVLQGEFKNKSHRNLKRTESFVESFSSRTEESETDQRTSERYELDKESSKLTSSQTDLSAGVSVTAGYGPVSVTAGLDYASSNASSEASSQAVNMSKEVTNRAVNRIKETIEERRSQLSINEVEVINQHGINNEDGTGHINGFYYWVNKVYKQQVLNRGKRLMLEFMVPEPAAFHIYSKMTSSVEGVNIEKPINPKEYTDDRLKEPLKSFTDITRDNYQYWASVYDVQDPIIPPSDYETVNSSFVLDYIPEAKSWHDIAHNTLKMPSGYKANYGKLSIGFSSGSGRYIAGYLGNHRFSVSSGTITPIIINLDGERDIVPFSYRGHFTEYHMNVEIFCSLTPQKVAEWQQKVYQSIISAYETKLGDYEDSLALSGIAQGISIEGDNPEINRDTEKVELKKWGIEMLTLQRFGQFNAMKNARNGHPEINFQEAYDEGKFVKFFEQSIEWGNMTYVFYPYFWGRKPSWTITKQFEDTDPMFTKFLQAGYARVVVPVHPKFTKSMLHYLSSGEIWQGEGLPGIDDDLYLSIVEEIQESQDIGDDVELGDSWEITVPTNLVMLSDVIPNDLPGS